jgi:hypothetical protein
MARAPVSKTGGWGFESLHSCQLFQGFCASPREQGSPWSQLGAIDRRPGCREGLPNPLVVARQHFGIGPHHHGRIMPRAARNHV